jgi:hypothetical protein
MLEYRFEKGLAQSLSYFRSKIFYDYKRKKNRVDKGAERLYKRVD